MKLLEEYNKAHHIKAEIIEEESKPDIDTTIMYYILRSDELGAIYFTNMTQLKHYIRKTLEAIKWQHSATD